MKTKLNIGCGRDIRPDWYNLDRVALDGVNIVGDCAYPDTYNVIPDNSLEVIEMSHILEHILDPLPMMEALWNKAKDGCLLHIAVPHGAHDMAFADPQHIKQYFPSSFQFFAQPAYKRADYGYRGDWESESIIISVDPNIPDEMPEQHLMQLIATGRNIAWEMRARLKAIKPMRDVLTEWDFNPEIYIRKAR